ncbi:MAG: MFS transporter [Ignavibacteria bacterium]|nr:MFS transporter [Ignavibacteria bacterium]
MYLLASVNLALKVIGEEFVVNPADLGLINSVYLLLSSICIVPLGKVSDILGPKKTLLFGASFFIISNLLVIFFANSFLSLLIFRTIQGIAASSLVVSNTPIITTTIPAKYRTTALGILSGLVYSGTTAGNFIGGFLTQSFGWRSIFISAAIAGGIALLIIKFVVPDREVDNEASRKFDLPGIVFYALALIFLQGSANRLNEPLGWILFAGFAAGLVAFIYSQYRSSEPIYDIKLFRSNSVYAVTNISVFITFLTTYASQYLLGLYLQCNREMSPVKSGIVILIQPVLQLLVSPLAGFVADKTSPGKVSAAGMGLIALSLVILANLGEATPMYLIYFAMILTGSGIALFSAPNTSIMLGSVPESRQGSAVASNYVMLSVGMQTGIIICGLAFLFLVGKEAKIQKENFDEMLIATQISYWFFAIMATAGFAMLINPKHLRKIPDLRK